VWIAFAASHSCLSVPDAMSDSQTTVTCGNCGRVLEERSDLQPEQREPCPVCGSTARSVNVVLSAAVAVASGVIPTPKIHVDSVPADETVEAAAIRGRYRATLDWSRLESGFWLLQVLNESGDVVDGGVGDDPEKALLEVYERLIPPK
jgi:hypothetical protein